MQPRELLDRARAGTLPDRLPVWGLATLFAHDTDPETLPDDVRWEREKYGHLGRDPVREGWERRIEYACHSGELPIFQAHTGAPFFIERAAFRAWLSDQSIEPGEHVRSWLRPLEHAEEVHQEEEHDAQSRHPAEQARSDDIRIEIDVVVDQLEKKGERVTAASVMRLLRGRAGTKGSCITDTSPDGVLWERGSSGEVEKLTMEALKKLLPAP